MTGALNASAGLVTSPSYTFNGATKTGLYLAGANQIGIAVNGVQAATINSDTSTTWAGAATFSGTISAPIGTVPVGGVMDFAGSTAPAGWLLCFGQLVSTTIYAALFTAIGSTYGSGAGTFGIPDYRGRASFGKDNMGGSTASRITASINFDGTVLGNTGGNQSSSLLTTNLPPYTPSGTVNTGNVAFNGANISSASGGGNSVTTGGFSATGVLNLGAATITGFSFTGNAAGGASTGFTNLPPAIISNKIIFAGV